MKATINKNGILILMPQSELEQYALDIWCDSIRNDLIESEVLPIVVEEYEDDSSGM